MGREVLRARTQKKKEKPRERERDRYWDKERGRAESMAARFRPTQREGWAWPRVPRA